MITALDDNRAQVERITDNNIIPLKFKNNILRSISYSVIGPPCIFHASVYPALRGHVGM